MRSRFVFVQHKENKARVSFFASKEVSVLVELTSGIMPQRR